MKTMPTILFVVAVLAAAVLLPSGRSGLAQQSEPEPTLASPPAPLLPAAQSLQSPAPSLPTSPADDVPQNAEVPPDSLEPEVLTHGPVHEAFAEPVVNEPGTELIVPKAPPEVIDEVPPEFMPEGENVEWIPGYWGWDDELEDYIWVSGLWRRIPPGQRWVPGHWTEVDGGYTWVAGFWTGAEVADLEYLPNPPATLEQGPNIAAPGDDYFWVPGNWTYQATSYNWQPGYWAPAYDDWCWVPRRYIWTPRGALFSGGYWDYRLPYRGVLFAPVYFGHRGFWGPSYRYRPYYTLNPAGLLVSLFVRPGYRHYYFGDYYGPRYRDRGFIPWHRRFDGHRRHYDPLYSFYDSYYRRQGIDFGRRMNGWHDYFDSHPDRRPERVLNVSTRDRDFRRDGDRDFRRDGDRDSRSPIQLARSLNRLAEFRDSDNLRLRRVDDSHREVFNRSRDQVRTIALHRSSLERQLRDGAENVTLPDRGPAGDRGRPGDRTSPGEDRRTPADRRDGPPSDRRDGPPSVADAARDARPDRGGRDDDAQRGTSPRDRGGRLELPESVRSRIAARDAGATPDSRQSSGRTSPGRESAQPPSLDRGRRDSQSQSDRPGRGTDRPPGLSDRAQQSPSPDRSGRGPAPGAGSERTERGRDGAIRSREGVQPTPSRDQTPLTPGGGDRIDRPDRAREAAPQQRGNVQQTPRPQRSQQAPRIAPRQGSDLRSSQPRERSSSPQPAPSVRQQAPPTRSTPPAAGPERGRSGDIRQSAPRQQAPQPRIEPRSSGRIEAPRGPTINRGPQPGNRPEIRSQPQFRSQPQSRPQIRSQPQSRPQIRSQPSQVRPQQPQIRNSAPQVRRSSPPQVRSRSQGSSRGPERGSGNRGNSGRGGRGRR